jgi:hypothetical protein
MTRESLSVRVSRLEAAEHRNNDIQSARDHELATMKATYAEIDAKLELLIEDKNKRDGAIGFGKWIVGTGFFAMVGSAVLAVLHLLGSGR